MNSSGTKEDKSTTIAGPFAPVLRSMHTYSTYNFEYDSQELLLVQKNKLHTVNESQTLFITM